MSFRQGHVKSPPAVHPTPAAAGGIGPDAYTRWRATTLGAVTEALEQRRILELVGPVDGERVLDLGSGDGRLTAALAADCALAVGIDVDRSMLHAAMARTEHGHVPSARFVGGRLERLPFQDGTFDVVVAVTVLCLVPDQTAAVREAARVLRPGGRMVIGDLGRWNAWAARRRIRGWFGSRLWRAAHFFSAADLTLLLQQAGLAVEAVRGSVYYPPLGLLAQPLSRLDGWLSPMTTLGAAFIVVAATKPVTRGTSSTRWETRCPSTELGDGADIESPSEPALLLAHRGLRPDRCQLQVGGDGRGQDRAAPRHAGSLDAGRRPP